MTDIAATILACCGTNNPLVLKLRGSDVRRFHADKIGIDQDVAQHTCRVMIILDHLWPNNAALLRAALYHDLAEVFVGDSPAPLKRHTAAYVTYKNLEHEYEDHLGFPAVEGENHLRLKAADYLELVLTTVQVPRSQRATQILLNGINYIEEIVKQLSEEDGKIVMALLKEIQKGWVYG